MSHAPLAQSPPAIRGMVPVLTPRNNPYIIYHFFLNYIPSASLIQPNTLSNNDTISILCYTLATTPEYSHAWVVFKILQEDELRANAGVDISTLPYPSSFAFPPSQFLADISKRVVEFWKVLEPSEIAEWSELACDIRIAHAQLVATFGNGIVFDGKDWEEQRQYHARTLYFKWMGLQAVHGAAGTSDNSLAYAPVYMTQVEINSQSYGESFEGVVDPDLTSSHGHPA